MRRHLPLALLLLLTACGGGSSGLIGTWGLDVEKAKSLPGLSDQERQMLPMMAGMSLTITSDTITMSMELMGQKESNVATYKVKSQSGKTLVVETTDKDGKKEDGEMELDGDSLVFVFEGKKTPFKRR